MKRGLIVAGLVLLAAALVFFNQGLKKSAVSDEDEKPAQAQSQAQKMPSTPVDLKAILPPEETVGNPATAKHHIQVGWVYEEAYYRYPESLVTPIQAVRDFVKNSGGTVSAEIVDIDVPLEDRSPAARAVTDLGLHVDDQYLYGGNLSATPLPPEQIMQALNSAINKK
jgi:hypothetical protein